MEIKIVLALWLLFPPAAWLCEHYTSKLMVKHYDKIEWMFWLLYDPKLVIGSLLGENDA